MEIGLENRVTELEKLTRHLHNEIRRLKQHLRDAVRQFEYLTLELDGEQVGTEPPSQA